MCFHGGLARRDRCAVALTKTKTDRKALKEGLVETVRECVDKYPNLFVINFDNLRSTKLKELRREWADDTRYAPSWHCVQRSDRPFPLAVTLAPCAPRLRILFGKNKVMQIALGTDEGSEYRDNLSLVSQVWLEPFVRVCLAC